MVEVKITKKSNNHLMHRDEIECIVNFEGGTPKQDEVKGAIAKELAVSQDLLIVNQFKQNFGAKQASVVACVYKSAEGMKKAVKKKEKKEKKPAA